MDPGDPSKRRIMSWPICTMGWVTSFNKHCTLSESVHVSLINPMFVLTPDATCSYIRCKISSRRSQMLHGLVQYASCLPSHSSLRTSTYCWSSSAAPRLSSDRWSPANIFSLLIVDYMTETLCRLLVFVCFTAIICPLLVVYWFTENIHRLLFICSTKIIYDLTNNWVILSIS